MSKSYELLLHGKQGDDLGQLLEAHKGDIPTAPRAWADHFKHNHDVCMQLAKAFEGKDLTVHADTHHISFEPGDNKASECLEVAVKEELIDVHEYGGDDDGGDVDGGGGDE